MLCFPIEVAAMKTAALLVAASAMLVSSLLVSTAFAQSSGASNVPPPPGIHDPGVKAVAPPADATLDLKPQALPAMHDRGVATDRDPSLPQIRVRQEGDNSIQEYSRNGRVYMVVVTPRGGVAQTYMVDPEGRLVDEHGQKPARPVMYKVLEWGKSKPAEADSTASPQDGGGH
jgi:hypothetical protein